MRLRTVMLAPAVVLLVGGLLACAKRKQETPIEDDRAFLPAEALYQRGVTKLAEDNLKRAREDLERIVFTPENLQILEPLVKLRLADVTFYNNDALSMIDARSKYLDFVTLHGDHPLAPYSQFQAGICSLKQVSSPTKDQSQTHTSLNEFREVLRRYPLSSYASAAQSIIVEAEGYLADHEFVIGLFYYKKKVYSAAATRFRTILDRYASFTEKEKVYFYMGKSLMLSAKEIEGRSYLERVAEDYPDSEYAQQAAKFLVKNDARIAKQAKKLEKQSKSDPEPVPESETVPAS